MAALYLQSRKICERVKRQLLDTTDVEKSASPPGTPDDLPSDATTLYSETNLRFQLDAKTSLASTESVMQKTELPGVFIKRKEDSLEVQNYIVDWDSPEDPHNPRNWSKAKRLAYTFMSSSIGLMVILASFIDSSTAKQAAEELHVSEMAESLATGLFLIGFALGVLTSVPLCELFGRGLVYIGTFVPFMIWTMASALAPNFAAQIIFRFLAGFCGSAPLTAAGVSIFDMWNPKEQTWAFPIFGLWIFGGPALGPVVGAWIGPSPYLSWRWSDWIILIGTGVVFIIIVLFMPETKPGRLLQYKAVQLRKSTGDDRFKTQQELELGSPSHILKHTIFQHFVLLTEPIIFWLGLYMFWIYMVLLSFLCGYKHIFAKTYGTDQGLTGTIFVAIFIGVFLGYVQIFPIFIYTKKELVQLGDDGKGSAMRPEVRLLCVMWGGAAAIPISLFWMGWTNQNTISIWSGIFASVLFGYGIMTVYLSAFLYVADSYKHRAATALAILTFLRYIAASALTTVGFPFYGELGVPWSLTLLGVVSFSLGLVPYVLYYKGPRLREKSEYAFT